MDSLMRREAFEAPDVAARQRIANRATIRTLAARLRERPPTLVYTSARGSSGHAATFAKYLLETRLEMTVASQAPSLSSVYGRSPRQLRDSLFLAISQSGRSPDLLSSAEAARKAGAFVVALVNDATSPLAALADTVLPLHAGPERSVAATKSFVASLLALVDLTAAWVGDPALDRALDEAPGFLETAVRQDWATAIPSLSANRNLYVLGRGLTLAIAAEAALKFKETCGLHAEAFSEAEVRHGPMALVGPGFPVLMFAPSGPGSEGFVGLSTDFAGRGAVVLTAGLPPAAGQVALPMSAALDPVLHAIAQIAAFYPMADLLARQRGLDPDFPPFLRKVTETR